MLNLRNAILERRKPMIETPDLDFDGFYFIPGKTNKEMKFAYFKLEQPPGNPIEKSDFGDKYHVAIFKKGDNGRPEFDGEFEAVFGDPTGYATNLIGQEVYGCVLRKCENSTPWWKSYLDKSINYLNKINASTT